jgi:TrmH family RNA methyltransferase
VLGKNSVEVYNEKVVRATMGSLFRVSVHTQIDLEEFVDHYRERHEVIGTSLAGVSLTEHENGAQGQPRIIIFGNESHGLSPKLAEKCDALVKIEGSGVAESLNLAISAAIIMYSLDRDAQ